ncbi:hypothetical protein GCM10027194_36570 [Thalassiella azotivora]
MPPPAGDRPTGFASRPALRVGVPGLALAVVLLGVWFLLEDGPLRAGLETVLYGVSGSTMLALVQLHGTHRPGPLRLIATMFLLFGVSSAGEAAWLLAGSPEVHVGAVVEEWADLVGYASLFLAVALALVSRFSWHKVDQWLDPAVLTVATGLAAAAWSSGPGSDGDGLPDLVGLPIMIAVLLVGIARVLLAGRSWTTAGLFLAGVLGVTSHTSNLFGDTPLPSLLIDASPIMAAVVTTASMLPRQIVEVIETASEVPDERNLSLTTSASRLLGIGTALVVSPVVVLLWSFRQGEGQLFGLGTTLLTALALWRLWIAASAQEQVRRALLAEVTERRSLEAELRRQARTDSLTGLANRAGFLAALDAAVPADGRLVATNTPAVLFLDLDDFKPVNDRYGHGAGDDLLRQIGSRLLECVREGDVVARLGGDEFAVLLRRADDDAVAGVADRLLAALRRPVPLDVAHARVEVTVTGSVGACLMADGDDAEALVRRADSAMYAAKQHGKNHWESWTAEDRPDRETPPAAGPCSAQVVRQLAAGDLDGIPHG